VKEVIAKGSAPLVPEEDVEDVEVDDDVDVEDAEAEDVAVAEVEDVPVAEVECLPEDVELVPVEVAAVAVEAVVEGVPVVPAVEWVAVVLPLDVVVDSAGQSAPSHGSGGAKQPPANAVPAVTSAKIRVEFARMSAVSGCQDACAWTWNSTTVRAARS
jgi:hypothetical protein